jgi:ABC-type transporter Mla subunit MlaD
MFLFSCNAEKETLIVTFEKANGLIEGNPVVINDYKIGEVSKITLSSDYKINAEIRLIDTIRIPKDSKFTIGAKDLFTKAIIVTPGKSKYYYSYSDKIIGQQAKRLELDTLIDVISNELKIQKQTNK